MANKVWVYIDQFQGHALATSWEVLGAGRILAEKLGGGVTALVLGHQVDEVARTAVSYGADEVLLADDASLADYRAEPYASVISGQAGAQAPDVLLFPTTTRGRELAAMSAVDLKTGVLPDVTALEVDGGRVLATRPIYAGKLLSKVVCKGTPQVISLRVRAFARPQPDSGRTGTITPISPAVADAEIKTKVVEYLPTAGGVSLTEAGVIVSGGRGLANNNKATPPAGLDESQQEIWKAQEGFKLLGALADVLGGAVGASRAAVDAGYIPYVHQVGQTGKVVSPDLYIAAGISGAIQHQAGMRSSKVIVAINKDPDAPIFKMARYGVVGDLYDILPPLTEALRKKLGK